MAVGYFYGCLPVPCPAPCPWEVTQARRGSPCPVTAQSLSRLHKEKACGAWETEGRGPELRPCCMEGKGRPDPSLAVPRKAQRRGRSAGRGTCVGPEAEPKRPAPPQARGRALWLHLPSPGLREQSLQLGLLWGLPSRSPAQQDLPVRIHTCAFQSPGRHLDVLFQRHRGHCHSHVLKFLGTAEMNTEDDHISRPFGVTTESCAAQSNGRSPCQKAQDKPGPNSCQAQSLLMRRARARQERSPPRPQCGRGSGPRSLVSTSTLPISAWRRAQPCQGQMLLGGRLCLTAL